MRGNGSALRYLAAALGGLFLAATAFQLLDQLNLIFQPPTIPDTANLVESVTARIPYRQQVWPLFLAANGLFALGFIVLSGLGIVLARRVGRDDDRGAVLLWTLGAAGSSEPSGSSSSSGRSRRRSTSRTATAASRTRRS